MMGDDFGGMPSRQKKNSRLGECKPLVPTWVIPAPFSGVCSVPGAWLWGEGQGPRTAADQPGRAPVPREWLQGQIPGSHQACPPPAAPGQEAQ